MKQILIESLAGVSKQVCVAAGIVCCMLILMLRFCGDMQPTDCAWQEQERPLASLAGYCTMYSSSAIV
jgi:hypothetical protein